jgi:hypothetical protein
MAERKRDGSIIDLTEVVEEGPGPGGASWMESAPTPAKEVKAPAPASERKVPEVPRIPRRESPPAQDHLSEIPESPLKKFLLADDEPTGQFIPPPPPAPEKTQGFAPPGAQPPRPAPQPPRFSPAAGRVPPEPPGPPPEPMRAAPELPRPVPEPPRFVPDPPKPAIPSVDAEMRALREAMLNRVEKWAAQEGAQVLERVAREIFPRVAEKVIREEIEKLKKEAEESE